MRQRFKFSDHLPSSPGNPGGPAGPIPQLQHGDICCVCAKLIRLFFLWNLICGFKVYHLIFVLDLPDYPARIMEKSSSTTSMPMFTSMRSVLNIGGRSYISKCVLDKNCGKVLSHVTSNFRSRPSRVIYENRGRKFQHSFYLTQPI